jgi:hypothetical protein
MPVYINPDFRRLPSGLADAFDADRDGFFQLPAWYDLMVRSGVPPGTETRVYTDQRAGSSTAVLLHTTGREDGRRLGSLTNAHSLEHDIVHSSAADLETALAAILSEILDERPRWDCLSLSELDPRAPSYAAIANALRGAGLMVACSFDSGTWYEDTAGLSFADYLAARPSSLRNTWHRKTRKIERTNLLVKRFFEGDKDLDQAVADYQSVYSASWKPAEFFPDFVPALIRLAGELGALRLGIFYLDGIPAAAQLWVVWHGRAFICKLAHDKRLTISRSALF